MKVSMHHVSYFSVLSTKAPEHALWSVAVAFRKISSDRGFCEGAAVVVLPTVVGSFNVVQMGSSPRRINVSIDPASTFLRGGHLLAYDGNPRRPVFCRLRRVVAERIDKVAVGESLNRDVVAHGPPHHHGVGIRLR